jgi:hypothetical protein
MIALGSKCLVGDQLHPNGAINPDTYASIAPAYRRVEKLEPFLHGAKQVSEIAILSAEHMNPKGARNHPSDDGAAQMLQELKRPFDVLDSSARFEEYRLLILPDEIPVDAALASRLKAYLASGGKIIASWHSGIGDDGAFAVDFGIERQPTPVAFKPSYVKAGKDLDPSMPEPAFVFYDEAETVRPVDATVLAAIYPSYFNRSYKHFCSHQHAPDDTAAEMLGAAVTEHGGTAYIAYPIFRLYRAIGQPLYKYVVRGLLDRLVPDPAMVTDLPSSGRATLTRQIGHNRHILHLLYGPPQIRGKDVRGDDGSTRVMEMIEDIPAIGPVNASVRLPAKPKRVFDAMTGEDLAWEAGPDGAISITVPRLRIHSAVVFEGA